MHHREHTKLESLLKNKHSIPSLIICVPMSSSVCGGHNTDHCGESHVCLLRQSNGIPSTCFILNKFPQGFPNHICSPTTCVITMPVKFFIHNSSRLYKSKNTYNHPHTTHTHLSPLLDSLSLPSLSPPSSYLTPKSPLSSPFNALVSPPLLHPSLPHSTLSPSFSLYLSLSPPLFPPLSPPPSYWHRVPGVQQLHGQVQHPRP